MSELETFVSNCLVGKALPEEIDDYVDRWHGSGSEGSLAAFLGMTDREYEAWLHDGAVLPFIIKARRENRSMYDVLADRRDLPMAARSGADSDVSELINWLERTGRI